MRCGRSGEEGLQDGDVGARVDVGVVAVGPEDDEVAAVPWVAHILKEDHGDAFVAVLVHDQGSRLARGLLVQFKDQFLSGHASIVAGEDVFGNA